MEVVIGLGLVGILGYTLWNEVSSREEDEPTISTRSHIRDYYLTGGVYEEVKDVISSGRRLLEIHLYADENGKPIVAKKPLNLSYDYAYDYWTFDSVCVDLIQAWENTEDPFILSIVPHSVNNVTLNKAAECLKTTVRRHLVKGVEPSTPLDDLKNRLILVSDNVKGSELGELINLFWSESKLRRILYSEGMFPRDRNELIKYNRSAITLVVPDTTFGKIAFEPKDAFANGCQWVILQNSSGPGFVEKPASLQ
jgi:hypothetical protein